MNIRVQTHGGDEQERPSLSRSDILVEALVPADGDIAVDEAADFGYLLPPSGNAADYITPTAIDDLDRLGDLMVPDRGTDTPDSGMPAVMTYWGQFLDHELTARTDRETVLSKISDPAPLRSPNEIERLLKNARTPRFDLDSVYGGLPIGLFDSEQLQRHAATVKAGMRHPKHQAKMRVGSAVEPGPLPDDSIDRHRDLPRFHQVEPEVRNAMLEIAKAQMDPVSFSKFKATLPKRALIGDMRNDENLIVAQFHLSFLRFHNKVVDYLCENDTGWIPDYASAKELTTLHYQWLIVEGFLKTLCDGGVVSKILANRAKDFFAFRSDYAKRNGVRSLGNVLPLEFSVAAYRFGHSMVRRSYDYNRVFGRNGNNLGEAPFDQIFAFTGGGGLGARLGLDNTAIPQNWVIDWSRFVTANDSFGDGAPQRVARAVDTSLAPPLGDMVNEGGEHSPGSDMFKLFRQLARRNLRRGMSLNLPTGQALHAHLKSIGAVTSDPITDVAATIKTNTELADFLRNNSSDLNSQTPLWFYCLAEAEGSPGPGLGELGSWLVASTFIGVMLDDPESALSRNFTPDQSPLRMPDGSPVNSMEKWMKFAHVME